MMLYGSNYVMWKLLGSKAYSNERNITYIIRKWRSNTLTMNITQHIESVRFHYIYTFTYQCFEIFIA